METKSNVMILLSTYNGAKYISAQLDSLLSQKDVNVKILIRDDGSKDETLQIINQYSQKHENILMYEGENVGPAKSFFDLVQKAGLAEYYAFCDQDDVWNDDKIISAVKMIDGLQYDGPVMYSSSVKLVDENLDLIGIQHLFKKKNTCKYNSFVEAVTIGCTVVMNRALVDLLKKGVPEKCTMHDAWVYMVAQTFGKTVYDFTPHILYRQHKNNAIGMSADAEKLDIGSLKKRVKEKSRSPRYMNAFNFLETYGDEIPLKKKKIISKLITYKNSLFSRLTLLLDFRIRASSIRNDVRYRASILLGLI